MKTLLAPALSLLALPALADSGAHLHPHGSESWLPVLIGLSVAVAVGFLIGRKSR